MTPRATPVPASPHGGAAWIVILAGVAAALHVAKLPPALLKAARTGNTVELP